MDTHRSGSSRDPFHDFITHYLDLDGIEILDARQITHMVRNIMREAFDADPNQPGEDYLDDVQAMVRAALARELMTTMVPAREEFATTDKRALEWLVRLAITLAYVGQGEVLDQSEMGESRPDDDYQDARRLRQMLRTSLTWVRNAAVEGDMSAQQFCASAEDLLDETRRLR
jgi:hypothetical protein